MPIKEESFRIGCGRYLQGQNYIEKLKNEVEVLGTSPIIVGDSTALGLTKDKIDNLLAGIRYEIVTHNGTCNSQDAEELAAYMHSNGFDVIVGVGGGVIMDFAKLIGNLASLPIINIPTSSATCAAYTPLSVCYTQDGRTVGTVHHKGEVNCVIADTEIIKTQPVRLLLSGIFDSLAKYIEIKQRFNENMTGYPLGLNWAYILSKGMFEDLCKLTETAIKEMESGQIGDAFERVVFDTICTTGVISGIARGSNQCALAHKFYETARKMFFLETKQYLHGEIVGVGLILQNYFNGESEKNDYLLSLMKKYNMPYSPAAMNLHSDGETKKIFFEYLSKSSAIDCSNPNDLALLSAGLDMLFSGD